jgi:hypothetical protein
LRLCESSALRHSLGGFSIKIQIVGGAITSRSWQQDPACRIELKPDQPFSTRLREWQVNINSSSIL